MKRIRFLSFFWGKQFLDMYKNVMLKSLFLPTNIPEIEGKSEIIFDVYCTPNEKREVKDTLSRLSYEYNINDTTISSDPFELFKGIKKEMQIAIKDGSLIVGAQPDLLFCNGLAKVIKNTKPYDYVICGQPRIDYEKSIEPIKKLFQKPEIYSVRDNRFFVDLAMRKYPHPLVRYGLKPDKPYGKNIVFRAIEKDRYYMASYREPPPVCFYPSKSLYYYPMAKYILRELCRFFVPRPKGRLKRLFATGRIECLDHKYVDHTYKRNNLKIINDSRTFFWMEFTSNKVYIPTLESTYNTKAIDYINSIELRWWK